MTNKLLIEEKIELKADTQAFGYIKAENCMQNVLQIGKANVLFIKLLCNVFFLNTALLVIKHGYKSWAL